TVFTTVYRNTDAVITAKSALGNNQNNNALPPSFPATLLGKVRKLPGVAQAEGGISDYAQLVGRNGKVISGHGAPPLAFSVHPHSDQRFNPLTLVSGAWPVGPHQVAIDAHTATKDTNGFLSIINDFLLAFGGVALFVGSFVIANTLSITIAQRTRELATLRTLGATRRQVLRSVLLEALIIGAIASVAGLFLGL